jgi:hypothetical protein
MKFDTEFSVGETVLIAGLEGMPGLIEAIRIDLQGVRYLVGWWHDGKRETELLFGCELRKKQRY